MARPVSSIGRASNCEFMGHWLEDLESAIFFLRLILDTASEGCLSFASDSGKEAVSACRLYPGSHSTKPV